ncbi:hypothetical protein QBC47DRAFT_363493 [Echria macrotheca]|uniref:mRNA stability protein n=1 Tax=Echria macrotheca TaxID=438768 RepID=A0AAJ0F933_9PEZI|nr:hypothetical protein QBC47DRAFT_363493 [Echria macrotheca]
MESPARTRTNGAFEPQSSSHTDLSKTIINNTNNTNRREQDFEKEEARLIRLYGRRPSQQQRFAWHLAKERKYFDSGDYALSKAGVDPTENVVGQLHPLPGTIPHPHPHPPPALGGFAGFYYSGGGGGMRKSSFGVVGSYPTTWDVMIQGTCLRAPLMYLEELYDTGG